MTYEFHNSVSRKLSHEPAPASERSSDSKDNRSSQPPQRRTFALAAWAAQVALTAIAAVACLIDVESIIFTLPLLSVAGLVLMIAARSLRSPVVLAHGLLAPAINLCSFQAIVWFNLGPAFAQTPLSILLSLYTISVAPLAIWALAKLRRWESEANVNRPYRWQFGMRTLMIAMTVLAITLGALSLVAKNIPGSTGMPRVEFVIFVGYQIWLVLATGAAAAWCLLRGPDPGHLNSSASA